MKRFTVVLTTLLAFVALTSLAACKGGAFSDPGHEAASGGGGNDRDYDYDDYDDWGDLDDDKDNDTGTGNGTGTGTDGNSSGGGAKPSILPDDASLSAARSKVDEIIAYCDSHPGPLGNSTAKGAAQGLKTALNAHTNSTWSYPSNLSMVISINNCIAGLQ
jgi:hypothetical protein